jgi:DNA-binding GntR family transcriptional regulator
MLSRDPHLRPTRLDEADVRELNAAAAILESLAVRLSPRFDGLRRARLRGANMRLRAARSPVAATIADREFHRRLVELCPDDRLLATLRSIWAALQAPEAQRAGRVRRHAADHDRVIEALADGDNARAGELVRGHVISRLPALLAAVAAPTAHAGPSA